MTEIGATKVYTDAEVEEIARECHEQNRNYCESMHDYSQSAWEYAPPEIKASAIAGVRAHLAVPEGLNPRESHEEWMRYKLAEGWRYGDVKDLEAKTHPCLVPYDELPLSQQKKDEIFGAIVRRMR